MKLYRAVSSQGSSAWTTSKKQALRDFEDEQSAVMDNDFGVEEFDSVELESIEIPDEITDELEDNPSILKKMQVVADEERQKEEPPREHGYNFDYWVKWEEMEV